MSSYSSKFHPLKNLNKDLPSSIVVFLVALPLCLGIALASGAPLYSGLIAGIVGGIVIGMLSGSSLGVSGPAAGLAVIVLGAIGDLGGFQNFLVAVVFAGLFQIILGFLRGGIIGYYFPSSVITGMLSGIGIIIFMKQIPHAVGYDKDYEGDLAFWQMDGENTFSELINMLDYLNYGAIVITAVSLAILLIWEIPAVKKQRLFQLIPGPLVAVILGIVLNVAFQSSDTFRLGDNHSVTIPVAETFNQFLGNFSFPNFAAMGNPDIYVVALVMAVVASLETLLSVEAVDKLDPHKRVTPTNRELKAQGIGNMISGLIGGLPVTQVIVRSSANVQSGGVTKASAVIHGFFLLGSIILIPKTLNLIPYATLAAILFLVGYKLAKPSLFKKIYRQGWGQFIPFIATIIGIVFTDLLIGLGIGLASAVIFILYNNFRIPYKYNKDVLSGREHITISLAQELTFLNKASLLRLLSQIPDGAHVTIDASGTYYMHHDVQEILEDFRINAQDRGIHLKLIDLYQHKEKHPEKMKITFDDEKGEKTEVIAPQG